MLGHSHAASGAVAGLAAGIAAGWPAPRTAALAVLTAGAALLPDLDSCGGSAARSLGFLSGAVAHAVRRVSGGHRHATHSLAGIAAFAGLAWLAGAFRGGWAGKAGLALLVALCTASGLEALRLLRGHRADTAGLAAAVLVAWLGAGLALVPLAVLLGCVTHCLGDSCTRSGVNWLWPCQRRFRILPGRMAFATGTAPERLIVLPLLLVSAVVLAVQAADPLAVHAAWHAALARL